MSRVFAIGDIQGCLSSLNQLIKKLPRTAKIICLGDLINRGPDSLGSLRRLKYLQETGVAECILGNHELNAILFHRNFCTNNKQIRRYAVTLPAPPFQLETTLLTFH